MRWMLRILFCLILGAMATVGDAWWWAWSGQKISFQRGQPIYSVDHEHEQLWAAYPYEYGSVWVYVTWWSHFDDVPSAEGAATNGSPGAVLPFWWPGTSTWLHCAPGSNRRESATATGTY